MAVVDPLLAALASHVLARPSGDVIGNTSLNNLRSKLKLLLATLELSQRNFSGYSLRRGGAANAFASGTYFDTLLVMGRWQSVQTARQYLDSGREALVPLHFSTTSQRLITLFSKPRYAFLRAASQEAHLPALGADDVPFFHFFFGPS